MRGDLEASMKIIFGEEGGYVNNPKDPGGATKFGITAATLGAWRKSGIATPTEVRNLSLDEARLIVDGQYAQKISFDKLPPGLDLAVLDFAINSGPAQAGKTFQRVLGVDQDGVIGARTISAIPLAIPTIIDRYMDARLRYMKGLGKLWTTFGKGWSRRVERIRVLAKRMAIEEAAPASKAAQPMIADSPDPAPQVEVHKAPPSETSTTSTTRGRIAWGTIVSAGATAVVPWAHETVTALKDYESLKYVGIACLVLTVVGAVAALIVESKHIANGAPQ